MGILLIFYSGVFKNDTSIDERPRNQAGFAAASRKSGATPRAGSYASQRSRQTYGSGDYKTGAHHAHIAQGHLVQAKEHGMEASKKYAETHGQEK